MPFAFGIDENGNYGYIKDGADSVTPFKKKVFLGTYNSTNKSIDMTSYKNYEKFTIDDFVFDIKSVTCAVYNGDYDLKTLTFNKSYDSTTGVLTFSLHEYLDNRYSIYAIMDIYLIA